MRAQPHLKLNLNSALIRNLTPDLLANDRLPTTKYQETTMPNNGLSYQVQDVPPFIQDILMKYGEKTPIGNEEFICSFSEVVLKKVSDEHGFNVVSKIKDYANSYIVHSSDGRVIITMGIYLDR